MQQLPVSLEKLDELWVGHSLVLLGLVFNTRAMTVGITDEYREQVLRLIANTWHEGRKGFVVKEVEMLVVKLNRLAQGYRPIYHLLPHMYASIAFGLRANKFYLSCTSRKFRKMLQECKMTATSADDQREIRFFMQTVAKKVHGAQNVYRIPDTFHEEL